MESFSIDPGSGSREKDHVVNEGFRVYSRLRIEGLSGVRFGARAWLLEA